MKLLFWAILLATATTTLSNDTALSESSSSESVRFICGKSFHPELQKHVPTTFAWTSRGKTPFVRWASEVLSSKGYTPQLRCEQVSPRFQTAYNNGTLNYLTNAIQRDERVICSVREKDGSCDTVLLTLLPEDKFEKVLQQLNDVLDGKASAILEQSSGGPKIYIKVDLNRFLRNAPVEP